VEISVRTLRLVPEGRLRAFVDLQVGDFVFRDFRIIQSNGDKAYLAAPQTRLTSKDGRTEYKTLITMPKILKQQAETIALAAFYSMAKGVEDESSNTESL
jgi:DNA-binding cell septation regulator SpoVG